MSSNPKVEAYEQFDGPLMEPSDFVFEPRLDKQKAKIQFKLDFSKVYEYRNKKIKREATKLAQKE